MESKVKIPQEQIIELQLELDYLKDKMLREIEGLRTTMVVLQDKEAMKTIEESEKNRKNGKDIEEFIY